MRRFTAMLGFLALVALACTQESPRTNQPTSEPQTAPSPTATIGVCIESIVVQNGRFVPDHLVVPRNCAVLFTNRSDAVVQVHGKDSPDDFLLGEMGRDQSWAHTYKTPGEFELTNTKDPGMRAKVTVHP